PEREKGGARRRRRLSLSARCVFRAVTGKQAARRHRHTMRSGLSLRPPGRALSSAGSPHVKHRPCNSHQDTEKVSWTELKEMRGAVIFGAPMLFLGFNGRNGHGSFLIDECASTARSRTRRSLLAWGRDRQGARGAGRRRLWTPAIPSGRRGGRRRCADFADTIGKGGHADERNEAED